MKSGDVPLGTPLASYAKVHARASRCGMRDSVDQRMPSVADTAEKFCEPTRKLSCAASMSSNVRASERPSKNASSFDTSCPVYFTDSARPSVWAAVAGGASEPGMIGPWCGTT
jgi:hypothetical protein